MTSPILPSNILISGPFPAPAVKTEIEPLTGDVGTASVIINILEGASNPVECLKFYQREHTQFNLDAADRCGWTCMAMAINEKSLPLVRYILDQLPAIRDRAWDVSQPYISSAVGYETFSEENFEMLQLFLDRGANINAVNQHGDTPLFLTSQSPTPEGLKITKFLLLRGAILYQSSRQMILDSPDGAQVTKDKVTAQPQNIQRAIDEIKHEYNHAYKHLSHYLVSKKENGSILPQNQQSMLARMPNVLATHIMSFLPATHLRYQFLVNHGFIKVATPAGPESGKATPVPSLSAAVSSRSALSLDPAEAFAQGAVEEELVYDFSHETLIDTLIASAQPDVQAIGPSSISAASVAPNLNR